MNALRDLRTSRGWTQKKLGEKAHIAQGDICKLESGYRLPFPYEAAALAMIFRTPTETLFPDVAQGRYDGLRGQRVVATPPPLPPLPLVPIVPYPREFRVACPKCGVPLCHKMERGRRLVSDDLTCYACGMGYEVRP